MAGYCLVLSPQHSLLVTPHELVDAQYQLVDTPYQLYVALSIFGYGVSTFCGFV